MSKNFRVNSYLTLAMLFWGLGTVLTKSALNNFDSLTLLPIQLASSSIFLGLLLFFLREKELSVSSRGSYLKLALLGVLNPGIAYALGLSGLAQIPASISVVIWATEPLLITVLAYLFIRGTVKRETILAIFLATSGVLLIIGKPSGQSEIFGILLTFLSVGACAGYSILLSLMKLKDGSLFIVFIQQLIALIFALFLMFVKFVHSGLPPMNISEWRIFEAAVAGIAYYGIAFWLYVSGLRRTSALKAGTFLTLIPVFGLFFSVLLLKEHINQRQILGSLIVIAAVVSLSLYERRGRTSD
ncbi:MAG: DMT family transporter [Candidatus Planktophila sp.]|nr:DMT family transporter [Candidatus Planktophila sp.]